MRLASRTACALLLAAGLGPALEAQIMRGPQAPDIDWEQRLGEELPLSTPFTDSAGAEIELADCFAERPVILVLVYYECPMLCDLVLNGLVRSLRPLAFDAGDDFDLVVISIDHEETVDVARAKRDGYLEQYGRTASEAGWRFLVGSEESVRAVAGAVGFGYEYLPSSGEYAHAAGVTLLTPQGKVSRYFYGTEFAPRDIKFGLIEAADGTIGSPIDKVILRCFSYDPARGKYGFAILGAIRFLGALTVLVLVGFIVRMVLRDRRRALRPALEEGV